MRTQVTVDLAAIVRNYHRVRRLVNARSRIIAIVKGDAYGHGAEAVARALAEQGDLTLGVSYVSEALSLRHSGIRAPLLVLYEAPFREALDAVSEHIALTVSSPDGVAAARQAAARARCLTRLHMRVDTGLGPPGVPLEKAIDLVRTISADDRLLLEGLFTHLTNWTDDLLSAHQLALLCTLRRQCEERGVVVPLVHAAASGGIVRHPDAHLTAVRPGRLLYGPLHTRAEAYAEDFETALTWTTFIVDLRTAPTGARLGYGGALVIPRPTGVATLPVGYADGLRNGSTGERRVLVRGQQARIIGRVTMDTCLVDVTSVAGVQVGDEVVLLGRQGDSEVSAIELASALATPIPEIWCQIGARVPRFYVNRSTSVMPPVAASSSTAVSDRMHDDVGPTRARLADGIAPND